MSGTDKDMPEGVTRDPAADDNGHSGSAATWNAEEAGNEMPEGVVRDTMPADDDQHDESEIWNGDDQETDRRTHDADGLTGDRGISPVGGKFGGTKGQKMAGLGAFLVIAAVAAFAVAQGDGDGKKAPKETASGPARSVVDFEGAPPPPPTIGGEAEAAILAGVEPGAIAKDDGHLGKREEVDPRVVRMQESQRAGVMAYSTGPVQGAMRSAAGAMGGANGQGGSSDGAPIGVVSAILGGVAGERSELDGLRGASSIGQSRARMLPNRNFLITAGTQIPCILQTAMDTATPGFVTCLVSRDVYSDNGNTVLMEKGTRVLGEYRGGLKRGQNRMFVVWNRAVTPKGVAVDLASPAADALGRAGMNGDVENFFWQRFGGAILLSVVDDAVAVASRSNEDARQTVRQPSDAASIALENSINIPPVLRKAQGEYVSIMAANDFDFSAVYRLTLR